MNTRNHPIEAEELMAYLDGELAPDQAAVAANHLETCMECQQLAADLRGVSQTLNAWELQPTNSTLPKSLAAAVEERMPELMPTLAIPLPWYKRPWFRAWAPTLAGCAAVATVIVGSVSLIGRNSNAVYSQVGNAIGEDNLYNETASLSQKDESPRVADKSDLANEPSSTGGPGIIAGLVADSGPQARSATKARARLQVQNSAEAPAQVGQGSGSGRADRPLDLLPTGPMIIRTAELSLTTREFDKGRAQVEDILKRHHGYVGMLNVTNVGAGRVLTASLRIPSTDLDATLGELKALGRLTSESKNGQEISAQYVDLQARLTNSRNTEHRLIDLLQNRTGKLTDVLEVENELARVRGEVESMEAERKNLSNQVDFATLNLTLTEDYRAQLQVVPPSTSTRLINAAVEGYRSMVDGLMAVALFLLTSGPTLLLWAAILFFPARFTWRRLRRNLSGASL